MNVSIDNIKPNPKNPRVIKDEKFAKLVKSLTDFPQMLEKRPLVCFTDVDGKLVVLGGNMRLKAAQELKFKELPILLADDWTEEQKNEFLIKDNVGFGEWNWDELANDWDVEQLTDWGLDIPGFDVAPEATEDDFDGVPPKEPITVFGDLYELNEHRLHCADSCDSDAVTKLMGDRKWFLGFTSPPYNSGNADFTYNYKVKKEGGFYNNYKDDLDKKAYKDFLIAILDNYVIHAEPTHSLFWNQMYNANSRDDYGRVVFSDEQPFQVRETIVWNKISGFPVAGDNILSRNTELVFLLSNSKKYLTNQNNRTIYWNRWDISNQLSQDKENGHKACFPIGLPSKAIVDFSIEGMIVLDLFLGSGTTLIASDQLSRICYGQELDPKYCDVIVSRFIKHRRETGSSLVIKRNGQQLSEDEINKYIENTHD